jgi:hypothetical protein
MAETKKEANAAFDLFVETYGVKYERAVAKLIKDREALSANRFLITHEPQPISAGGRASAGFGRWPRSGEGSWLRDRSAC